MFGRLKSEPCLCALDRVPSDVSKRCAPFGLRSSPSDPDQGSILVPCSLHLRSIPGGGAKGPLRGAYGPATSVLPTCSHLVLLHQGSTLMGGDVQPPQQWGPGMPPHSSRTGSATSALLRRRTTRNKPRRSPKGTLPAASVMVSILTRQGCSVGLLLCLFIGLNSMVKRTCTIDCRPSVQCICC